MSAYYSLVPTTAEGGLEYVSHFVSDTLGHAQTLAQSFATLFATSVTLVVIGSAGPYTTYTPGSQGTTVSCPSGITIA